MQSSATWFLRERAALGLEVPRQEAPGEAAPVHRRPAHAFAGPERAEVAHRQRRLVDRVPKSDRFLRKVLHQLVSAHVLQLVVRARHGEVGIGIAPAPALHAHHFESGVGQFFCEDRSGETDADRDDVDRLQLGRHGQTPALSSSITWIA